MCEIIRTSTIISNDIFEYSNCYGFHHNCPKCQDIRDEIKDILNEVPENLLDIKHTKTIGYFLEKYQMDTRGNIVKEINKKGRKEDYLYRELVKDAMWNKGGGYPYRNDSFTDKVRQIIDFQRSCKEFKKDIRTLFIQEFNFQKSFSKGTTSYKGLSKFIKDIEKGIIDTKPIFNYKVPDFYIKYFVQERWRPYGKIKLDYFVVG